LFQLNGDELNDLSFSVYSSSLIVLVLAHSVRCNKQLIQRLLLFFFVLSIREYIIHFKRIYYRSISTKKQKMTDYLTHLPIELIHKIFNDVPSFDILTYVYLVNKRLHLVSLSYRRFQFDFSCLKTKKNFDISVTVCLPYRLK